MPNTINDLWTIIVTYNAEQWIEACLDSLRDSTISSTVMVIDNCSQDSTVQLIRNRGDILTLRLERNLGFGRANNLGIAKALEVGANFVMLVNQDARVAPEMLEQLVLTAHENPDYGVFSPIHRTYDGQQMDGPFATYVKQTAPEFFADLSMERMQPIYPVYFVPAALWLLRREAIEDVGGFDPAFFMYGEDDDLVQRFSHTRWKVGIVPQATGFHWHGGPEPKKASRARLVSRAYTRYVLDLKRRDGTFSRNLIRFARDGVLDLSRAARERRPDKMSVAFAAQAQVIRRLALINKSHHRSISEPCAFLADDYNDYRISTLT